MFLSVKLILYQNNSSNKNSLYNSLSARFPYIQGKSYMYYKISNACQICKASIYLLSTRNAGINPTQSMILITGFAFLDNSIWLYIHISNDLCFCIMLNLSLTHKLLIQDPNSLLFLPSNRHVPASSRFMLILLDSFKFLHDSYLESI